MHMFLVILETISVIVLAFPLIIALLYRVLMERSANKERSQS